MIFSQIFPTMSATNNPSDWFQIFGADRNIYWKKCRSNKINSKLSPLLPWACYQPGLNLLFFAGGRWSSNICTLVGYGFEKCHKNTFEFIFRSYTLNNLALFSFFQLCIAHNAIRPPDIDFCHLYTLWIRLVTYRKVVKHYSFQRVGIGWNEKTH